MAVDFQYVGVDVSESLNTFTEEKLEKIFNRYEFVISATVRFKHDANDHNKGKICDIELSLPRPHIFATSHQSQYEVAVRETIKELERQLKKRKDLYNAHKMSASDEQFIRTSVA